MKRRKRENTLSGDQQKSGQWEVQESGGLTEGVNTLLPNGNYSYHIIKIRFNKRRDQEKNFL